MDYSIFKPGDRVRSIKPRARTVAGVVLFANEKCLLIQRDGQEIPENYTSWEFEKIPERTSRFCNVYTQFGANPVVEVMPSSHPTAQLAKYARGNGKFIGVFEQVFEDGKLVETKYHPDENA